MPPKPVGLPLSELLTHVAGELRKAVAAKSSDEQAIMQFQECELELAVTLQAEGGAGVKFWVVSGNTKVAASNVSKIRVKFNAATDHDLFMQAEAS